MTRVQAGPVAESAAATDAATASTGRTALASRPARRGRAALRGTVAGAAAAGFAAAALTLGVATPAAAHDYVVASSPADGAVVDTALTEVSYTFNAPILDLSGTGSSNVLEVVGPDGLHYETGCVATVTGPTASVGVALGTAGTYTSSYQVVSSDGHTVSDSQTFEYAPPAGTPEAEGQPSRPSCDDAAPGAGAEATSSAGADPTPGAEATVGTEGGDTDATPAPDAGDADAGDAAAVPAGLVVGVAVAIVVVALAAVVVLVLTSRRRRDGAPDGNDDEAAPGT